MAVTYFTTRRRGPELEIEDAVAASWRAVVSRHETPLWWLAGSPRIGAGRPDLAIIAYESAVSGLSSLAPLAAACLALVKSHARPTIELIVTSAAGRRARILSVLDELEAQGALSRTGQFLRVNPSWSRILPSVVTVEAKVSSWALAIRQAVRNRIFAHESYIAVPEKVAKYALLHPQIENRMVGVIEVGSNGSIAVSRRPRRGRPDAWLYYFQLAELVAANVKGAPHAVRCDDS